MRDMPTACSSPDPVNYSHHEQNGGMIIVQLTTMSNRHLLDNEFVREQLRRAPLRFRGPRPGPVEQTYKLHLTTAASYYFMFFSNAIMANMVNDMNAYGSLRCSNEEGCEDVSVEMLVTFNGVMFLLGLTNVSDYKDM